MFEALRNLVSELTHPQGQRTFEDNDLRLAAAALLVHAADVDGSVNAAERTALHDRLKAHFDLDEAAVATLIEQATVADHEAVDLYRFTSLLLRTLDEDGRRQIVEMMWQIVCADGKVTEFEDNLLWRVTDLLGISSRDRIELKHRVIASGE